MRRLLLGLVAAVAAASVSLSFVSTTASHREIRDRNDARGLVDVRSVVVGSARPPRWTIYTWNSWTAARIWDRAYLTIKLDTFGDAHFDYYALIRSAGNRLLGTLHRDYARKRDSEIERLRVTRPGKASVRVRVPFGEMRFAEPGHYRWNLTTSWIAERCPAVCFDRAPDKGAVEEPAPAPTIPPPPPTLTPTPSESEAGTASPSPSSQ